MRRHEEVFTSPLDDKLLMLSLEQGRYFSLSGVGPRIWELLATPISQAGLIARLGEEFEVAPEVCQAEVAAFLQALRDQNLLIEVD
ncbi:PqqD family peptide modification chaperone [Caulobacter sp. FWC2]|uniref:PqqD family peptide modification chaperone n=1 Tax=Caulobacter sp. FWC2 TaxID=69664 RepID=UPI000C14FF7A|nr:PqqD family peptide modification chaperone [Caulobacter sp. FWC2]PIB92137.1 PqqD family protein [Caulobacter sp. FWC2]